MNQHIGSVITKSGRMIAFPNLYQHKVAPFKLTDPSKNGIRKILVFFLVDPATYIPSTSSIPPQQVHNTIFLFFQKIERAKVEKEKDKNILFYMKDINCFIFLGGMAR